MLTLLLILVAAALTPLTQADLQPEVSAAYAQMAREKRQESMVFLKEQLAQQVSGGKTGILLRLADMYLEEARASGEAAFAERAVAIYKQLAANYPQYARADEVYWGLGGAYALLEQPDEALNTLTRLVKLYPESRFIPNAYAGIGDEYAARDDAYRSLRAYQKAAQYRDSTVHAYALYRLAWCYYLIGEYSKGIDTMKVVVSSAADQSGGLERTLTVAALEAVVFFCEQGGDIEEGREFFRSIGLDYDAVAGRRAATQQAPVITSDSSGPGFAEQTAAAIQGIVPGASSQVVACIGEGVLPAGVNLFSFCSSLLTALPGAVGAWSVLSVPQEELAGSAQHRQRLQRAGYAQLAVVTLRSVRAGVDAQIVVLDVVSGAPHGTATVQQR